MRLVLLAVIIVAMFQILLFGVLIAHGRAHKRTRKALLLEGASLVGDAIEQIVEDQEKAPALHLVQAQD